MLIDGNVMFKLIDIQLVTCGNICPITYESKLLLCSKGEYEDKVEPAHEVEHKAIRVSPGVSPCDSFNP